MKTSVEFDSGMKLEK